jgi:transcription termination factor Rho
MAVLSRDALEQSPLADLHLLATELGIDGFRRLRKAELVDAIISRQSGEDDGVPSDVDEEQEEAPRPRRGRRGGRGRSRRAAAEDGVTDEDADGTAAEAVADEEEEADEDERPRRGRRGGRGRARDRDRDRDRDGDRAEEEEERIVEGTVELLGNGSGFLRVNPPEPSDDDVYISAAQVRRCELVSGDTVSGPMRPPRRSERYPSLVRVDTINGRSADEVAEGTPFEELPAAFPSERWALGSDDATLKAIEWLTPLGRGSRATIVGGPRAGKSEALRRLAGALQSADGVELTVVLAGVRPEEVGEWKAVGVEPAACVTFAASADAQGQAVERVVETAKRIAARGGNAVVLVDTLAGVHEPAARRLMAAARNIVDGGSLTIVATAEGPIGGETTVIALDATLTSTGRFPAIDLVDSGTLRPELLVGDAGADAIAQARAAALDQPA